ncbi:MAG TPA: tetratricopeptide repeat protein [Candidatus Acidoferrales bacterium]
MNRHCAECFFLLVFALLSPAVSWSQRSGGTVTISGNVYIENANRPILNAAVSLCDAHGGVLSEMVTSATGEFSFQGIPAASYVLKISAEGFETLDMTLDLTFASDRGVPIYLKPAAAKSAEPAAGNTISTHEMSMPRAASDLFASGKRKMYSEKNPQGALADFQAAAASAPGYYEAFYQMALVNLTLHHSADAETNLRKSIEVSSDKYAEAEIGLGTVLLDRGEKRDAEKALRRGLELNDSLWLGHYELGRVLFNQKNNGDALKSAERAKALSPNSPDIYRLLANIHLLEQNYPAVLVDIDAYVKLDPDSAAGKRAKELRGQITEKMFAQGKP